MSTTVLEAPTQVIKLKRSFMINSTPTTKPGSKLLEGGLLSKYNPFNKGFTMHDIINFLATSIRDPIADIQERRGIPRYESQSFLDLLISLFNYTYNAFSAIFLMVFGLFPIFDGLVALLRFCVDKIIEINNCEHASEKIFKLIVFLIELGILFLITTVLISLIILPIYHLVHHMCFKAWKYSACI